jgi:transposase InsO family protein
MFLLRLVWAVVHALFAKKADLVAENLAFRQQLIVLHRKSRRPRLKTKDRVFWLWLARSWDGWRESLIVVEPATVVRWQPATVVRWHRQGFKYYWAWKSRHKGGRPAIDPEVRDLIRRMSRANPLWGAPRIHGELLKLGIDLSQTTVAKYMIRHRNPPSPSWRAFLDNHLKSLVSIDFFTVPTVRFRILFVFLVLSHDRRRIVHFNVTEHPSAEWTGRQLVEAFPWDTVPRYLIRDRDGIYGQDFTRCVNALGIKQILLAPRSPWQNPYVERVIGSVRRECLDHVVVFNENHLRRVVKSRVVAFPEVGGLHHRYTRRAA